MRWKVCAWTIVVLAAATATAMAASAIKLRPHYGQPDTVFRVSFADWDASSILIRTYHVDVSGPARNGGCVHDGSWSVRNPSHARVRVTLDPAKLGGKWCPGTFHGNVNEAVGPGCKNRRTLCPHIIYGRHIGHFTFHVSRSTSH